MNPLNKLPYDKALHIIAGVLVYAAAHFVNPLVGMAAVTAAAVGKEVYDYMHKDKHTPDAWDAIATIGGGLLAFICGIKL
jgi:hypothetical protein